MKELHRVNKSNTDRIKIQKIQNLFVSSVEKSQTEKLNK